MTKSKYEIRNPTLARLCFMFVLAWAGLATAHAMDYEIGAWQKLAPMPGGKFIHRSMVVNGYLYAVAGAYEPTFYSRIKEDGSLEGWKSTTPLVMNYPAAAVKGNRIYIVSGDRAGATLRNSVFYGDVETDGSIKEWKPGRSLPDDCRQGGEAVICGNNLFYIGGWHWRKVYRAPILASGDVGDWQEVQHLLSPRCAMGTAVDRDTIYIFGGNKTHLNPTDSSYRSTVQPDGLLKGWKRTTSLPSEIASFAIAQVGKQISILGGGDFTAGVFTTCILPDGNLAEWQDGPSLPCHVTLAGAAAHHGWLYLTGGWGQRDDGTRYVSNEVYAARLIPPRQYPLRFHLNEDAVKSLGWIQLMKRHVQKSNEPVSIEAEDSTCVELAATDMAPQRDPEASGGFCLQHVSELRNEIVIQQPGEYQAWYRAYFPLKGSWNHPERMDDNELNSVLDSQFGEDKQWLWVRGPIYKLTKGSHTYLWPAPSAWRGGTRLDKIVLVPQNAAAPLGIGPPPSPTQITAKTELISNRFRLDDMSAWHLRYEKEDNGGRVEIAYSFDRGKTWRPLTDDQPRKVTPNTKRVTFRIRLIRSADGASPRIRNLVLTE